MGSKFRPLASAFMLLVFQAIAPHVSGAAARPSGPFPVLRVRDAAGASRALAALPPLPIDAWLGIATTAQLDRSPDAQIAAQIAAAGAVPWIEAVFHAAPPLDAAGAALDTELARLAELAAAAPPSSRIVVVWRAPGRESSSDLPVEYAYLVKRAAAAIKGVRREASVVTEPFDAAGAAFRVLHDSGVAGYADALAIELPDGADAARAIGAARAVDAITDLVVYARAPGDVAGALCLIADASTAGVRATVLDAGDSDERNVNAFHALASELAGGFGPGPPVSVTPGGSAWSFVRERDLAVRLIARPGADVSRIVLRLAARVRPEAVIIDPLGGAEPRGVVARSDRRNVEVEVDEPPPFFIVRLERAKAAGAADLLEEVTVVGAESLSVEEIVRRLQIFEAGQDRRLESYRGIYTEHQRYSFDGDVNAEELTLSGSYFFRRGEPVDWAWEKFWVNGVKWRGKHVPIFELIQPQRAVSLPLKIELTPSYRYALRGTDLIDGRPCWVVTLEPADPAHADGLYSGTVWIDREVFARVRTQTVQLGLREAVISNAETKFFAPLDAEGRSTSWSAEAFVLPVRTRGQRVERILGNSILVEFAGTLESVRVNEADFEAQREEVYRSEATIVRMTPEGLRPVVKTGDEPGRIVDPKAGRGIFYLIAGIFYDKSLPYPFPLIGVSYYTDNLFKTKTQAEFFLSPLLNGSIAKVGLGGSRWNLGVDFGGLLFLGDETPYRDGAESPTETVSHGATFLNVYAGHPLGAFGEVKTGYVLGYDLFKRAHDTAADFVVPTSTRTDTLTLSFGFRRAGYDLVLTGGASRRANWETWGSPETGVFGPAQRSYTRYQLSAGKTWWGERSSKLGVQLFHAGGSNLDRFSKYGFGPLSDIRVAGYPFGLVTASQATGTNLVGAATLGQAIQLQLGVDAVVVNDQVSGLRSTFLGGVSVGGTFVGPWETIVQFDFGVPIAGPARGLTAIVYFLRKLR